MNYLLILLFSSSLFACQSDKKYSLEGESKNLDLPNSDLYEPLDIEASSENENYQAGLDFINSYIESIDRMEILEFAKTSSLASEDFISELENMLVLAWEVNPRIGLLADPIVDAQDYPPKGFELHEFDPQTGYLIVRGIEWEDFKVAMRIVRKGGHLLVDGSGVVNMKEDKRIER